MKRIDRTTKRRKPNLFLSHSTLDRITVDRLARDLGRLGVDVWFDEWDIEPGDSLRKRIVEGIRASKYVAIIVTSSFLKSSWCRRELSLARKRERQDLTKVVVPLLFRKVSLPPAMLDRLYLDFRSGYHEALVRLAALVHGIGSLSVRERIKSQRPRTLREAAQFLENLGWDGAEVIDSKDFDALAQLRGVKVRGNFMEFSAARVRHLNPTISANVKRHLRRR